MGNIKHNDELLRINDDGFDVVFNCDNKHQNGVSYHAEKNGKKTKIDPEYAMAALVKKISGGGWPAELPKPSVGGYGYTEQGEQTVITWDGDTEGRTFFTDFGINYYKIEDAPDDFEPNLVAGISDLSGAISDYVVDDQRDMAGAINVGATDGANALIVVNADKYASVSGADVTQNGVYFAKAEISGIAYQITSLTYGTPDTVHKIDDKYLSTVEKAKEIGGIAYTEFVENETIMSDSGTFHNNYVNLDGKELVLDEKYSCHIELGSGSDQVVITAEDIVAEGNTGDYEHSASLYFTDDDGNEWQIEGYSNPETDAPNTMAYTISCYDMDSDEDIDIFVRVTGPCDIVHTINPKYVPIEKGTGFYGTSCMLHDDITPDSAPGTEITYYPPSDFGLYDITVSEAIQRGVYVSAKIAIKVRSGAQTNTVNANLTFSEVGQTTLGRVCYFAGFSRPTDAVNDIYYVCVALPDFPEEHNNKATLMAIKKLTLS